MLAESMRALRGAQAQRDEPQQQRVQKRRIPKLALFVFPHHLGDARIHGLLIYGLKLKRPGALGMEQTQQHGDLAFHRQSAAKIERAGLINREVQREANRRFLARVFGALKLMPTMRGNKKHAPFFDNIRLSVCLQFSTSALVVEELVMRMRVRRGEAGE